MYSNFLLLYITNLNFPYSKCPRSIAKLRGDSLDAVCNLLYKSSATRPSKVQKEGAFHVPKSFSPHYIRSLA